MRVPFMFPLFLADLDKKYRNEIEMDKKIIVKLIWNMFISKLKSPERKENNSLTFKCRFKTLKIHQLCYVMEVKNRCEFRSCFSYS